MQTDRELLEAAAQATGIDAQWDCPERGMMVLTPDLIDTMSWNPLTDDGDALRLAVKLQIDIQSFSAKGVRACLDRQGRALGVECGLDGDRYAATRRAIVRAAASLATQTPAQTPKEDA